MGDLRETFWNEGVLVSKVRKGKETDGAKFSDYFDLTQKLDKLPSHRIMALFRGEKEEFLDLMFEPEPDKPEGTAPGRFEKKIAMRLGVQALGRPGDKWLSDTIRAAWRFRLSSTLSVDLRLRLWQRAEDEAVKVFAGNLRDLLLAAPAGTRACMGLDPGFRTGVKVAVVDATGKVVATATIYPHEPQRRWDDPLRACRSVPASQGRSRRHRKRHRLARDREAGSRHDEEISRAQADESDRVGSRRLGLFGLGFCVAGTAGSRCFDPRRVSIARRLQDPLAELVKIDPKSIGVGQYQHDIAEFKLSRSLDAVVEDCVNGVGVDVNTASVPLLARVSGIGDSLAQNIVMHRDSNGPFKTRSDIKKVARLGPKAFEQCAGFLRIVDGEDPLDASGVHPEAYPVVRRIIEATKSDIKGLFGNAKTLRGLEARQFIDEKFGVPTVTDILKELEKPGRDPRPAFKTAEFQEGVETLNDLKPGMILEGTVTNVAAFGAFVDIGVHQDGLVHVSAMSKTFVKDPREVVKPGQIVRVKVLEVDKPRKRIALTMRLDDDINAAPARDRQQAGPRVSVASHNNKQAAKETTGAGGALGGSAAAVQVRRGRVRRD